MIILVTEMQKGLKDGYSIDLNVTSASGLIISVTDYEL